MLREALTHRKIIAKGEEVRLGLAAETGDVGSPREPCPFVSLCCLLRVFNRAGWT